MALTEGSVKGPEHKVVVAIDIGTSYSGYAYSYTAEPYDIIMNERWRGEGVTDNDKAPTAILTDLNRQFKAFGYDAIEQFKENPKKHLLFRNFKMGLYKSRKDPSRLTAKSVDDSQEIQLKQLFSMAIRHLYEQFKTQLQRQLPGVLHEPDIKLIITVPSIWSSEAQNLMNAAAIEAVNIEPDKPSPKLVIAYEPIAASYMCRHTIKYQQADVSVGDLYMVVDCGGGTVDFAMHKMLAPDKIQEIHEPRSEYFGGTKVDDSFEKKLVSILGGDIIQQYKTTEPGDWLKLVIAFWSTKRSVGLSSKRQISLQIPVSFVNHCKKYAWFPFFRPNFLNNWINGKKEGFSYDNGTLSITDEAMRLVYKTSIDNIVEAIKTLLKDHEIFYTKYILLVGGYGESRFLYDKIKAAHEYKGLQVVQIPRATSAVLKGAVMFGHFPEQVETYFLKTRMASY